MANEPSHISFEFITDDALRSGLASDSAELEAVVGVGASKAAVVLAGSIVEAMLLDHLIATDYLGRVGKDPSSLTFAELVRVCKTEGVISERSEQLSTVVRGYRNLIHPGRSIRVGDNIDRDAAVVARATVSMIAKELAERPNRIVGITAEQLLSKLHRDPESVSLLHHLVAGMAASQKERLLIGAVQQAYLEIRQEEDEDHKIPQCLARCFAQLFSASEDKIKKKYIDFLVSAMKHDDAGRINILLKQFFMGWHLKYASREQCSVIVDRLVLDVNATNIREYAAPLWCILNSVPVDMVCDIARSFSWFAKRLKPDVRSRLARTLLVGTINDLVGEADDDLEDRKTELRQLQKAGTSDGFVDIFIQVNEHEDEVPQDLFYFEDL